MGYAPIPVAPSGVAAFVGRGDLGPVDVAVPIDGPDDAAERLGPPRVHGDLAHCLELYFANGGERAYAVRVDPAAVNRVGEVDRAALIGSPEDRTGVHAVSQVDDVDVLGVPDVGQLAPGDAAAVYGVAVRVCEGQRAMLLIDPPDRIDDPAHVVAWADASGVRSRNAAMYVPRLLVEDPQEPGRSRRMAPSPAVAGVYARTDALRAVWSAPAGAGAQLRGIQGLRTQVTRLDHDVLVPAGINTLRRFVGHGPLVWGARTLETDPVEVEWRYVAVRRFALFVERSVQRGLRWTAEEPNAEPTWAVVRGAVERFLLGLWRQGAFPASRPDQAFHVRCGLGVTMTADDVHAGWLVVELGLAPTRPAEFVSLRLHFVAGAPATGPRPAAPSPDGPPASRAHDERAIVRRRADAGNLDDR